MYFLTLVCITVGSIFSHPPAILSSSCRFQSIIYSIYGPLKPMCHLGEPSCPCHWEQHYTRAIINEMRWQSTISLESLLVKYFMRWQRWVQNGGLEAWLQSGFHYKSPSVTVELHVLQLAIGGVVSLAVITYGLVTGINLSLWMLQRTIHAELWHWCRCGRPEKRLW